MAPLGPQRSQGHTYADVHAHDQAYIHNGDIYNYRDASSEEKLVLEWLAPQSPAEDHNEALKQHEAGTLKWLFEDRRFTEWRDSQVIKQPTILWCRGQMGTGKTTLIAQVREHLHNREESRSGLAVAYCRYSKRNVQTAESILGSMIAQLYNQDEESCFLPKCVIHSYHAQKWVLPQMTQLEQWLRARSKVGAPVFVLLDAMDELDILLIRNLLRILQSSNLKLLVTSRDLPLLRQEFGFCTVIQIHATKGDLRTTIVARLERESTRESRQDVFEQPAREPLYCSVKEEIVSKIMESTDSMFLAATLHLNRIMACNSIDEVYHYLDRFPTGLEKLYDQAWQRATGDNESLTSQRARLILMWVSTAFQPLSVTTLSKALSAPKKSHGVAALLTEEELVAACAGLVRIEHLSVAHWKARPVVLLSHLSVQEYLDNNRQRYFPDADDVIVVSSLFHLSSRRIYMALSHLSGFYFHVILLGFILGEFFDRRYHDEFEWLPPEVIDFAALLAFDIFTSVWPEYAPGRLAWSSITLERSVLREIPSLDQYFQQNLRHHIAIVRSVTKIKVCLSLLYNRMPIVMALGVWSSISRCSRLFAQSEKIKRGPLFGLAKPFFCALLGIQTIRDSTSGPRSLLYPCLIILIRFLVGHWQATQECSISKPQDPLSVVLLSISIQIAGIFFQSRIPERLAPF